MVSKELIIKVVSSGYNTNECLQLIEEYCKEKNKPEHLIKVFIVSLLGIGLRGIQEITEYIIREKIVELSVTLLFDKNNQLIKMY